MNPHRPTPAPDDKVHPNPSFRAWVRHHPYVWITEVVTALALFVSFGYYASTLILKGGGEVKADQWLTANHIIHVVLLLAAGTFLTFHLHDNHEGRTRTNWLWKELFQRKEQQRSNIKEEEWKNMEKQAERAVRDFKRFFLFFLFFLLLDYGWQLLGDHSTNANRPAPASVMPVSITSFHRSGDGELAVSLSIGSKPEEVDVDEVDRHDKPLPNPYPGTILKESHSRFIEYWLNTLGAFALLLCFLQLRDPRKWRDWSTKLKVLLLVALIVAMLLPLLLFTGLCKTGTLGDLDDFATFLDWCSGAFNAWVMIVLFSRLDSKLIGLPSSLVAILYAYAAVQTFFAVFPWNEMLEVKVFAYYAFLILKLYFFFIIHYALVQGRIYCYMFCAPVLRELRESDPPRRMAPQVYVGLLVLGVLTVICCCWAWFTTDGMKDMGRLSYAVAVVHVLVLGVALFFFSRRLDPGSEKQAVKDAEQRWQRIHTDDPDRGKWIPRPASGADDHECYPDELVKKLDHVRKWLTWFIASLLVYYLLNVLWPLGEALVRGEPFAEVVRIWGGSGTQQDWTGSRLLKELLLIAVNSAGGLFIFMAFASLARPRTSAHYKEKRERNERFAVLFFIFFILVQGVSGLNMWPVEPQTRDAVEAGVTLWAMGSGLLVSMCFSLFIARFDGTLMWQSTLEVRVLMLYAAVQPMLVVFVSDQPVFKALEVITLLQALVLKVWLLWLVYRALRNGTMATYHYLFPIFDSTANKIFRHGFLIRNGSHKPRRFTMAIFNEGALVLSSHKKYEDQDAFMRAVQQLNDTVERDGRFPPPSQVNGAYTVQLHLPDLDLHFEGHKDFARIEDANEFIRRARTSLPYARMTYE